MDELGGDNMNRRRMMMNDKIVSAQGENLSLANVKGSKLNALSVYGKSTQDGTPSPENPVPIVSAGDSGEINVTVGGKNLFNKDTVTNGVWLTTDTGQEETSTEYWTSDYISVIPGNVFSITLKGSNRTWAYDKDKNAVRYLSYNGGGAGITLLEGEVFVRFSASNTISADTVMMSYGNYLGVGDYEPYKTPQTLTLSTPGGLPGIPVSSGGNYTDENGQQWICDEIDLKRGKHVKRVEKIAIDGEEMKFTLDGTGEFWNLLQHSAEGIIYLSPIMSMYFPRGIFLANNDYDFIFTMPTVIGSYFSSVNDLNEFCTEKSAEGQPLELYYGIEPIETDLTAEEIAAYQALHTYTPNTTVGNDADAWMKLTYKTRKSLEVNA